MKTEAGLRVIVAGSCTITDYLAVKNAIESSGMEIQELVSGGTRGVDSLGELYAREHGIPIRLFPADWDKFGKSAGYRRNEQMAEYADALIAIWAGSKGTAHTIEIAKRHGLPCVWTRGAQHECHKSKRTPSLSGLHLCMLHRKAATGCSPFPRHAEADLAEIGDLTLHTWPEATG